MSRYIFVEQIKSLAGQNPKSRRCVKGLGLRRIGHKILLKDNPSIRGLINKSIHLIKIEIPTGYKNMNIEEYVQEGRIIYSEFSSCVRDILKSAIDNSELVTGIQQIQSRVKGIESLSSKLKNREAYRSNKIQDEIKDLAGCRIIFYHNDDLNNFLHSRIVSECFDIDLENSKIHHPQFDPKAANDLYMGHHYLVSLKEDKIRLPKYARFAGMRCEIQIQTLLNHAWSETIHNITYKKRDTEGFGESAMHKIDDRLKNIMINYLRPAGYEFQKVKNDYDALENGREIFDQNIIKLIDGIESRNELYDVLERYRDYVLPNYSDYSSRIKEIYSVIEDSIRKSKILPELPIKTPFGNYGGKDYKEIIELSLSVLERIKYLDFDTTISILLDLMRSNEGREEIDVICESVARIVSYDIEVLKSHGYYFQDRYLTIVNKLSDDELLSVSRLVYSSAESILSPGGRTTERSYDKVVMGGFSLGGGEGLRKIRSSMIDLLIRLIELGDESTRKNSLNSIEMCTRTPNQGDYSSELLAIILDDTNRLIKLFMDYIDMDNFENLQAFEEKVYFHYKRAKSYIDSSKNEKIIDICKITLEISNEYRSRLSSVKYFNKYKILVGFRSVFEEEWDNQKFGWKEEEKYRTEYIERYIDEICEENILDWVEFFQVCVKADSSDLATFRFFSKFLERMAEKKPELGSLLLKREDKVLNRFMANILSGFNKADRADLIRDMSSFFIQNGEYLWECIRPFTFSEMGCRDVLHEALQKAIELDDIGAINQIISAVVVNYENAPNEVHSLFHPSIIKLTELGDSSWVNEVWYRPNLCGFISSLDSEVVKNVIDNLTALSNIDYHAECLLKYLAGDHPDDVIDFFGKRLMIEVEKEPGTRYDAIPHSFQEIHSQLSRFPSKVVTSTYGWFGSIDKPFQYYGANFVAMVFPEFGGEIEELLIDYVRSGSRRKLEFVIDILRNYEGQDFLQGVCKELVIAANSDAALLNGVETVLGNSGVLHGEFGYVESCLRKIEEIRPWLEDDDSSVQRFARKYIRSLERSRAAEQARSEEELELRKHVYR